MTEKTTVLHVVVQGELTIGTAASTREDFLHALDVANDIEVDLTRVTEIDSAGLQIMVAAKREAATRQKTLRFIGHSQAVLDTLDLTDTTASLGDPVLIQSSR